MNAADVFELDDEGTLAREIWVADFDDPAPGSVGYSYGLDSLGADVEANLGGGDCGGPSLVVRGGLLKLAAINTYGRSYPGIASPKFGTELGGILLESYVDWMDSVVNGDSGDGGSGGPGGGKGGGKGNGNGGGGKGKKLEDSELLLDISLLATGASGFTQQNNESSPHLFGRQLSSAGEPCESIDSQAVDLMFLATQPSVALDSRAQLTGEATADDTVNEPVIAEDELGDGIASWLTTNGLSG